MMDIGDVKKVIDNVAQKPFLCSDTKIETQNEYIITTKAHYEELLIAKGKETPCRVFAERGRPLGVSGMRSNRPAWT